MFKAILFDLDGTLLPLDLEVFVHNYFGQLAPFLAHKVEPKKMVKELMLATEAMINNDGAKTNEEVFMEKFLPAIGRERAEMEPLFEEFYLRKFPDLKKYAGHSVLAEKIVRQAIGSGYKVALATNPIFPEMATRHRMEWAGIHELPWELVTTYENSAFCKPNPQYFQEVCKKLEISPEECLMVGNDIQEDLVAGTLGMKTYLVTDCLIDRGTPKYQPDYQGSLEDLYGFIRSI
ncbi:MAG: HAD family hydrolase [Peptococcales bacterium]|jgi:FMN phosphatase YigB (HAD superfamily)